MAVRYSGEVEIRVRWDRDARAYVGEVSSPTMRWSGTIPRRFWTAPPTSDDYDRAALRLATEAERYARLRGYVFPFEKKGARITVSRIFESPCPTENMRTGRDGGVRRARRRLDDRMFRR